MWLLVVISKRLEKLILERKNNINLLIEILAHSEKIIDKMSSQEFDNHINKKETIKGIFDFYTELDFWGLETGLELDRKKLVLIIKKYLTFPDIQINALTDALLWSLIHLIFKDSRGKNNSFIEKISLIIRNKKSLEKLEKENNLINILEEIENDSFDIGSLKSFLKPYIDNAELPSLTKQLLDISRDKEKENKKIDKLMNEITQKWIDDNPIPDDKKIYWEGMEAQWASDDKYYKNLKKLKKFFIKNMEDMKLK